MNRKAKGSGFTMRSGNKTGFKEMGSSPAKTDASLVAAARDLGRSNIPKDNKDIVEKQYEGIIAYNKAKTQMTADIVGGVAKGAKNYAEGKGAIQNIKKIGAARGAKKELEGMGDPNDWSEKDTERAGELEETIEAGKMKNWFGGGSDDDDNTTPKDKIKEKLYNKFFGDKDDDDDDDK